VKSEGEQRKPKGKPHAGAHRQLHPNPTRRCNVAASLCQHCQADVSGVEQTAVHEGRIASIDCIPTNNGSEQAIRPCVTFRKVSGPNGAPNSTPTSDPPSKPQGAGPSGALQAIRLTLDDQPLLDTV
jgi:hypothetical protein